MVQVGDHDEPVGDTEPGEEVVLDDFTGSVDGRCVGGGPDHSKDTQVGDDDGIALRGVEDDRVGIEVVGPVARRLAEETRDSSVTVRTTWGKTFGQRR